MESNVIDNHKYLSLIKFALKNKEFSVQDACQATRMSEQDFNNAKYSFFMFLGKHENIDNIEQVLEWHIKPEAFFSYISYIEYKESSKSSQYAIRIAIISMIISAISMIMSGWGAFPN